MFERRLNEQVSTHIEMMMFVYSHRSVMCSCPITEAGKLLVLQANLAPKVEPPTEDPTDIQVYRGLTRS